MGLREVTGRSEETIRTLGDWLAMRGVIKPQWTPNLGAAREMMDGLAARDFFGVAAGTSPGQEFTTRFPEAAEHIVTVAREVVRGRIRLFGRAHDFGPSAPDWHLDWTSGQVFPRPFYRSGDIHRLDGQLDGRAVWEANRQQYLVTLAQAYAITGEEQFAERAVSDILSWIEQNPPFRGINWSEPLECAFRCLSWLWTLRLVWGSSSLTPARSAPILGSIWLQTRHTHRHLSIYRSPNTHVLGEALGLLATGTLLPGLRDAQAFRAVGTRVFWDHLDRQVAPDGSHREHSTYYHAYTVEMALVAFLLSDDPVHREGRLDQLGAMYRYLRAQTRPDGTLARMGDDDGGRALRLSDEDYYTPASLLGVLGFLTETPRLPASGTHQQDSFWYLGRARLDADGRTATGRTARQRGADTPETKVEIFGDVGVGVVRHGAGVHQAWASIHGNPMGFLTAGHSHASLMAVELSLAGSPVLVDPGTFRYVDEARREFRAFSRHNVLDIEGVLPPQPSEPFKWSLPGEEAWVADLEALDGGVRATRVVARGAVRHERCIRLPSATSASLEDRVTSVRPRRLSYSFHLPPGSPRGNAGPREFVLALEGGGTLRLKIDVLDRGIDPGAWAIEQDWYWMSRRYGERERSPCLLLRTAPVTKAHTRVRLEVT